jgi:hypothetical protein
MGASVIRLRLETGCSASNRRNASATKSRSVEPRFTAAILARFMRSSGRSKVLRINMLICFPAKKHNLDPRARRVRYRTLCRTLNLNGFVRSSEVAPDCTAYPQRYPQDGNAGRVCGRFSAHEIESLFRLLRASCRNCNEIEAPNFNPQTVDFQGLFITGGADGTRIRLRREGNQ